MQGCVKLKDMAYIEFLLRSVLLQSWEENVPLGTAMLSSSTAIAELFWVKYQAKYSSER